MRRAGILVAAALAAALAGAAFAAPGDPQKKHTKADQARARAASLRISDFASGWKATRSTSNDQSKPRCSKYNPDQSDLVETGSYDSPDFTRSADSSFISVSTAVFRTASMAKTGYARVARPALPDCFGELFAKSIPKGDTVRVTHSGPLSFPKVGNRSNAYRLAASVKSLQGTLPVTVDIVLFNQGRFDVALIFFGLSQPLPASLEQTAVARVASRVHE